MRERQTVADAALDSALDLEPFGSAAMVVKTTTVSTYPNIPNAYFACNPVQVTGVEQEGQMPTFTVDTATVFYALNLGAVLPANGTYLVCHQAGGRWTFRIS
jgi:hypothetical protein